MPSSSGRKAGSLSVPLYQERHPPRRNGCPHLKRQRVRRTDGTSPFQVSDRGHDQSQVLHLRRRRRTERSPERLNLRVRIGIDAGQGFEGRHLLPKSKPASLVLSSDSVPDVTNRSKAPSITTFAWPSRPEGTIRAVAQFPSRKHLAQLRSGNRGPSSAILTAMVSPAAGYVPVSRAAAAPI